MRNLYVSTRSASFEIKGTSPYYAPKPFDVYLNGKKVMTSDKNVFSLYSLTPDTVYMIKAGDECTTFKTRSETAFVDVRKFGAVGDGETDDTRAIQMALSTVPENSTIYFGEGRYRTTSLFFKSNITVYLDKGAVILGETDRTKYPILPSCIAENTYLTSWEGEEADTFASLISVMGASNVAIVGEGEIDANAQNGDWWINPKVKRIAWRPRTVQIANSDNVTLTGVTVKNSYSWTIHPIFSNNVQFIDVKIENPADAPNTDGIDPESCNGVNIFGCYIHVGDDCIAVKSCKYDLANKLKRPCENITIKNCHLNSGHGGIVIGSEMSGGVKKLTATNCLMTSTDRGLRIKTRRGRGKLAVISELTFRDIEMRNVQSPFVMNMFYFCDPDGHSDYVQNRNALPIDDRTPRLESFVFENVHATGAKHAGCYFDGLPEAPIESVTLKNVDISFTEGEVEPGLAAMSDGCTLVSKQAIYAENVAELILDNVTFTGYENEKYVLKNVGKLIEKGAVKKWRAAIKPKDAF